MEEAEKRFEKEAAKFAKKLTAAERNLTNKIKLTQVSNSATKAQELQASMKSSKAPEKDDVQKWKCKSKPLCSSLLKRGFTHWKSHTRWRSSD